MFFVTFVVMSGRMPAAHVVAYNHVAIIRNIIYMYEVAL